MKKLNIVLLGAALLTAPLASAQTSGEHWVATWAAAQQQPRVAPPPRPQAQTNGAAPTAANPPTGPRRTPPPSEFHNQTVRMIARGSIGGNRLRVELSNTFGTKPVEIGAAHIALRANESAIVPGSDRALLFSGKPTVAIPPGGTVVSDTVDLAVPKLADLAVSVFVPGETGPASAHSMGLHTTYISKEGDLTGQPEIADAITSQSWYWLSAIDVLAPADAETVVAFGDSITDGATSTPNTDRSWPSALAQRLAANPATADIAIVNEGISGNQVLADGAGVSALARFDRDVLSIPGVRWVTIMEGINDIGIGARNGAPAGRISADAVIGGLRQLVERAHMHGIKVIGCTLTPYVGAAYASEAGEAMREAVNNFIRTSGAFDAVFDFDKVTQDPANPKQILPAFNIADHLHPNDAGYKAMADSVDLSIFAAKSGKIARK